MGAAGSVVGGGGGGGGGARRRRHRRRQLAGGAHRRRQQIEGGRRRRSRRWGRAPRSVAKSAIGGGEGSLNTRDKSFFPTRDIDEKCFEALAVWNAARFLDSHPGDFNTAQPRAARAVLERGDRRVRADRRMRVECTQRAAAALRSSVTVDLQEAEDLLHDDALLPLRVRQRCNPALNLRSGGGS